MTEEKKKNICSRCGLCRETCEFFKLVRHESVSPRGKAILKDNEKLAELFYTHCTVCLACRVICPLGYDLEIESIRQKMVALGLETEANKEMIANIRKYGNPFGKIKAGEMPDKLYCC
ncbi:MAG: (Fe-S)-binding protein [Patescibacteria group bacterium]